MTPPDAGEKVSCLADAGLTVTPSAITRGGYRNDGVSCNYKLSKIKTLRDSAKWLLILTNVFEQGNDSPTILEMTVDRYYDILHSLPNFHCVHTVRSNMKLLRIKEVAAMLNFSLSHTYDLVAEGHFKTMRVGKSVRVHEESVSAFIVGNSSTATAARVKPPAPPNKPPVVPMVWKFLRHPPGQQTG